MTELTTVEQARVVADLPCDRFYHSPSVTIKLAQDYITVLAERDLAQSQLLECQRDLKAGNEQGEKAIAAYQEAAKERDALKADKERLDWLEENPCDIDVEHVLRNGVMTGKEKWTVDTCEENTLREAIDAARKENP